MNKFFKEYKNIIKSFIYFLFILFIIISYITQYFIKVNITNKNKDSSTIPYLISEYIKNDGQTQCGNENNINQKIIINRSTFSLYNEFKENSYTSFSNGKYKEINLNEKNNNKIKDLLENITKTKIENFKAQDVNQILCNIDINYKDFQKLMKKADKIIGKKSNYSSDNLTSFAVMNLNYKEVLKKDENFLKQENLAQMYSNEFVKSINKPMKLLPIILITLFFIKNKKKYLKSKNIDSLKDILIKYLAMLSAIITSIFALILISVFQIIFYNNIQIYYLVYIFVKQTIVYILPTVMFSTAIGFLIVYSYTVFIKSSNKGKLN